MAVKILFFIETLTGGGAEKVLCNLVNEMDQRRFEITVQTLWKAEPSGILRPGVRYRSCYAVPSRANLLRSRAEAALGLTYPLRIRDDYDIEVAYLEFGSTKILSRSNNRGAKKVAWVHSDLARKIEGDSAFQRKVARQYAPYDKIVCVSRTARDSFVRLFGREADAVVLYNTVDDAAIREKAELLPPDLPEKRRLTLAAAGRLAPEKRYDMLLSIHKKLLEAGLAHDLWIIGDGPERERLERLTEEYGLRDSVLLTGFRENPYPYLKAADLLVCSSRYEGLSTFVTEGLILGKPIVTTDCSGMRELLGESEYGLITDHTEAALLAGIRRMLSEPALRDGYGRAAAGRGAAFSADKRCRETERFFSDLLEVQTP